MPFLGSDEQDIDDFFGTTELALPHIATSTYPVARRYVRCYELIEHGFYSEAFIVAFSILDDLIQDMLHRLLLKKGMSGKDEREMLIGGIKENRLRIYLGPLLKMLSEQDIEMLWPKGNKALDWVNKTRNKIAHDGLIADVATAAKGVFVCIKILHVLHDRGLLEAEFSVDMFRHAKLLASWTEDAPAWISPTEVAEEKHFDS
jgi:hypothetical protein